jgi:hypothetical protein
MILRKALSRSVWMVVLGAFFSYSGKGEEVTAKSPSEIRFGPLDMKNAPLKEVIGTLASQSKVAICTEDVRMGKHTILSEILVNVSIQKDGSLKEALDQLQEQTKSISLATEDGVILVKAILPATIIDNPLDADLNPFTAKERIGELIRRISHEVPSFNPMLIYPIGGLDDQKQHELEFTSKVRIRTILNTLAREHGIMWHATLEDRGVGSPRLEIIFLQSFSPITIKSATKTNNTD